MTETELQDEIIRLYARSENNEKLYKSTAITIHEYLACRQYIRTKISQLLAELKLINNKNNTRSLCE